VRPSRRARALSPPDHRRRRRGTRVFEYFAHTIPRVKR